MKRRDKLIELWFGVALGALLLVAKMGSFYLLTHKREEAKDSHDKVIINKKTGKPRTKLVQRQIKRWILFGPKQGMQDRISESTFLLFCVDFIGGYVGAHILTAGGTIMAMVALTSYTIACMTMLMSHFASDWIWNKIDSFTNSFEERNNTRKRPCYHH